MLARPMSPLHLRPKTPYAPDALLPGDPGRAMALAQQLLTEPKMSNHNRGLWGYSGETADGRPSASSPPASAGRARRWSCRSSRSWA